ncbi:hypothetical protein D3C81_2182400 [compost metagenome]
MSKLYDHQGDETKIWATPEFLQGFVASTSIKKAALDRTIRSAGAAFCTFVLADAYE